MSGVWNSHLIVFPLLSMPILEIHVCNLKTRRMDSDSDDDYPVVLNENARKLATDHKSPYDIWGVSKTSQAILAEYAMYLDKQNNILEVRIIKDGE